MLKKSTTAEQRFRNAWNTLEASAAPPRHVRRPVAVSYASLRKDILLADENFVRDFTASLYAGDAYILKGAFPKDFFRGLVGRLHDFSCSQPPSFHKMFNGSPDFHRVIDNQTTKKYAVSAVRRGFYFYRWNDDPVDAFKTVTDRWRVFKIVSGLKADQFEDHIPEDGVIDRLVFYHYPRGAGHLKSHVDPVNNHKIIMGAMMSEQGVHFETGGFFAMAPGDEKFSLEGYLKLGDALILYPTVEHGVDVVDDGMDVEWNTPDGRWFMGLSSVDSDHVAERITAERRE